MIRELFTADISTCCAVHNIMQSAIFVPDNIRNQEERRGLNLLPKKIFPVILM